MAKNDELGAILNRIKFQYGVNQSEIARAIGVKPAYISDILNGRVTLSTQTKERLEAAFPEAGMVIEGHAPARGIPLIPLEAVAGFGTMQFSDFPQDCFYNVKEFASADFLVRVKGDSMTPKYNAGDIIACKRVEELLFFQWGRIYVVDTKSQGMMVKRIRQGANEEKIKLVSENPDYEPFDIPRSDINAVSLVMGAITLE